MTNIFPFVVSSALRHPREPSADAKLDSALGRTRPPASGWTRAATTTADVRTYATARRGDPCARAAQARCEDHSELCLCFGGRPSFVSFLGLSPVIILFAIHERCGDNEQKMTDG